MDPVSAFQQLSPEQILDAVETHDIDCDGRFLALNSYENRVYQIGVEQGQPVVVKFYRPGRWTDDEILEEHQFTRELSDLEIPVIAPLVLDGETLLKAGPFRFSVCPCRGGRAPELDNPDHLEMLGRFVGRMHAVGSASSFSHRPEISPEQMINVASTDLLERQFIPAHIEQAWSSLIDVIRQQVDDCYARVGSFQLIRLHGDLHHGNVLWTDAGPHVVDFDDARAGPSVQDIWMFLSGDREYQTARLADFMEGYSQFHEFDPVELNLVEALRSMRMIYHASWLASRWEDPAFPIAFPWFDSTKYWEQLILDLREQSSLMSEAPLNWS